MNLIKNRLLNNVFLLRLFLRSETIGQILGREELELKRNDSGSGYPGLFPGWAVWVSGKLLFWLQILLYMSDMFAPTQIQVAPTQTSGG